jgi:hypothetical protein
MHSTWILLSNLLGKMSTEHSKIYFFSECWVINLNVIASLIWTIRKNTMEEENFLE